MKNRRLIAWALALLLALGPLCACAEEIDAAWSCAAGGAPIQEWLDGELAQSVGTALDNYALCMVRAGVEADYSKYIEAAAAKLEAGISNASTRQRTALALIACGAPDRVPADTVDESAGKLGVMSWILALHLVLNGAPSEQWTAEAIVEQLLGMQLEDGGWKVTGEVGDVDVTAMCLQALAYCGIESAELEAAVERGLALISSRQLENGGFANMGNENAESSAQVLIALASLGIDPSDPRFVKDDHTPLDAMMAHRLPSGGFSHLGDGEESATATAQSLQALIALERIGEAFYDFSHSEGAATPAESAPSPLSASQFPAWKRWALIGIGAFVLAGVVFALTRRRGRIKQLAFVLILAAVALAAVCLIHVDSAEDYYNSDALTESAADGHVTLTIRCDSVAGRADDGTTPEDGVILPTTEIPFSDGETVYDALTVAIRASGLQMEHTGEGELVYINGINNLYEFAYGELSGWLYFVNGVRHSTGCGSYKLSDGDEILWQYTTELGEDLQ